MTDPVAIRPAVPGDEAFLRRMLYLALFVPPGAEPFPPGVVDEPAIAHYVVGWGRDGDVGRIAERGGRPIAAAWVRRWRPDDRGYGWVDDAVPELSIAVEPSEQGRGTGTRLVQELLAVVPEMSLSVDRRNPAVRLYERLGFIVVTSDGDTLTMQTQRRD